MAPAGLHPYRVLCRPARRHAAGLFGPSWGTVIGTRYARSHPGKVDTCIGVAQVVSTARSQAIEYGFVLSEARLRHALRRKRCKPGARQAATAKTGLLQLH